MVPMELDGKNLGEKHKNYNKIVKSQEEDLGYKLDIFNVDEDDVSNLIKIDLASKSKNSDYILKVLVCDDILYVSRAIKKCKWLFTEQDYSHIINAKYLYSELFRRMNTRSVNKLKKCLKLHLKDPIRVQSFYEYENDPSEAVKWLPNCSKDFIEENIHKHLEHINISLLRRLCERTIAVLEIFIKNHKGYQYSTKTVLESTIFLTNSNLSKYLDIVEELPHGRPDFGKRATALIMNTVPQRIIEKYELYNDCIHLETFIKFLGSKNIKKFLFNQASKRENLLPTLFNKRSLKIFIEKMPEDERLDFINEVFIDKVHKKENSLSDSDKRAMGYIYDCTEHVYDIHHLILFHCPFNSCLEYMKNSLQSEARQRDTKRMLSTIIERAKENQEELDMLIRQFPQNYNVNADIKNHFIRSVTTLTRFHRFDKITFNIVENLIMDKNRDNNEYAEVVLVYKILNDEVPDVILDTTNFSSLKKYKKHFNEEEKTKLFEFLYNYFTNKLKPDNLIIKLQEFEKVADTLDECLNILNDWDKNLCDYPFLIDLIRNLVKVRKENQWTKDISGIYNKNKSWKKCLFHISFDLYPSESVLINIIKHDAGVIEKYQEEINDLRFHNKKTITNFLKIIKIYWSTSIAKDWRKTYLKNIKMLNRQKASALGLCVLLPRLDLQNLLIEYAPKVPKIDYNNVDEIELSLQKKIAKIMHHSRPQPLLQTVMLYGQHFLLDALPALWSIFHNLSLDEGNKQILNMVDSQVSLQKHVIRLSVLKLNTTELSTLFTKIWQSTQHSTLRTVLFKSVHDLLCKENDHVKIKQLWELLETFIDNLNYNENKTIYDLLLQVKKVPISIRPVYFCKSYYFLKKITETDAKHKDLRDEIEYNIILHVKEIIELLPSQVVSEIVLEFIENQFKIEKEHYYNFCHKTEIVSAYFLCAKDENTQVQKYVTIFRPLIQYCSLLWKKEEKYMRNNLELLLKKLREDLMNFIVDKKMIVPIKMFELILHDLEEHFIISENYYMLTQWKLTVAFTSTLYGHKNDNWEEVCTRVSPQFGELCNKYLKNDCKAYFPRIYILYSKCLNNIIDDIRLHNISWDVYHRLVEDADFVEGHLAVINLYPDYIGDSEERAKNLREIIFDNRSAEVKMHYYEKFIKNMQ